MKILLGPIQLALFLLMIGVTISAAQNPVVTSPTPRVVNLNASGSIAVTNTFQAVFASNTNRTGCVIQNKGTNAMYIYFGAIGSATTNNSGKIAAGSAAYCTAFGTVLTSAVSITGTSTELFYAVQY